MNPGLSYRETSVAGANPVRLVILLYEQAMADLQRALAAQRLGHIEERTREINHALLVIGHLQATIDKEQGGKVAANLERFYEQVKAGLVDAQCRQSASAIERQIDYLMQVQQAWRDVERSLHSEPTAAPQPASDASSSSEWNA